MLGVDSLRQNRKQVDAHVLLVIIFIFHLKKRKTGVLMFTQQHHELLHGTAGQPVCTDVTSLRSSETSLAWAVSKVSGSRWNSVEERSFFREALCCS